VRPEREPQLAGRDRQFAREDGSQCRPGDDPARPVREPRGTFAFVLAQQRLEFRQARGRLCQLDRPDVHSRLV
jgi:hypothetical protein